MGLVASRLGHKPIQPLDFLECRDGWIFICCVEEHQWQHFVELMGSPEWAGDGDLRRPPDARRQLGRAQDLPAGMGARAERRASSIRRRRRGAFRSRRSRRWATCSPRITSRRAASSPCSSTRPAGPLRYPGAPYQLRRDAVADPHGRRRCSDSTPTRCCGDARDRVRPGGAARRAGWMTGAHDGTARRHPRRRLHLGVGGTVLHACSSRISAPR